MSRIIAHRGAHRTHGENTCEAFEAAVQEGAKWLETDVRLLADGALVLFHDDDLRRIYKRKEKISDLNEDQAQAQGIMSLRALLDKHLPIGLNLELKLDKNPTAAACRALGKAIGIFLASMGAGEIKRVLDAGLESYVYTINAPDQATPLWQAGLTGLFTDRLDLFAEQL